MRLLLLLGSYPHERRHETSPAQNQPYGQFWQSMTDHHNTTVDAIRSVVSYVAALLGIGTFAADRSLGKRGKCWTPWPWHWTAHG